MTSQGSMQRAVCSGFSGGCFAASRGSVRVTPFTTRATCPLRNEAALNFTAGEIVGGQLSGWASDRLSVTTSPHTFQRTAKRTVLIVRAKQEVRKEQKVSVTLGPYKDRAVKVEVNRVQVTEQQIDEALSKRQQTGYVLERVNFTGSGARLGHTVVISFEGKYAEGSQQGQSIKGTKASNYELELKERDDEPWKTIVSEITKAGMGQEESKTFTLTFPTDYKAKALAGVSATFSVTVHLIGVKKEVPKEVRPVAELREEVASQLRQAALRQEEDQADVQIRKALLDSSEADVEKVASSVTWAKFGEKSLSDFKWNVVQEEVARLESISFEDVPKFLRQQSLISYVN